MPPTVQKSQQTSQPMTVQDGDKALFEQIDNAILEGKNAINEHQDIFGIMADEGMGVNENGEEKATSKRGRTESEATSKKEDGVKAFFISKYRVDEAIDQIGADFRAWIDAEVATEHRKDAVNKYLADKFALLDPDEQLQICTMAHKDQIPAMGVMLSEKD